MKSRVSTREKGLVACARMMTSIKRSMRMIISCVKPQVRQENSSAAASIHTQSTTMTTMVCSEDLSTKGEEVPLVDVVRTDEAEGDELVCNLTAASSTTPTGSPVTSIANISQHQAYQLAQMEQFRQRIKRFTLEYRSLGPLLPDVDIRDLGKKCLVLDLDETLIHSQFNKVVQIDLEVPIQFEDNQVRPIYVSKRPDVDAFMEWAGQHFEVVIFTASLASYADPVIDFLDKTKTIRHRLYRNSCRYVEGLYLKDLSRLGRPLDQVILIDNAATSYLLQPENGVAIQSWFSDPGDTELLGRLVPALKDLPKCSDVYAWKRSWAHLISH